MQEVEAGRKAVGVFFSGAKPFTVLLLLGCTFVSLSKTQRRYGRKNYINEQHQAYNVSLQ
jgi:hypothetical protein